MRYVLSLPILLIPLALAMCGSVNGDDIEAACNTPSAFAKSVGLHSDVILTEDIVCNNQFILNGNGHKIEGAGIILNPGASWSKIQDVYLMGPDSGTGLHIKAHGVRLENIKVTHYDTGIFADSNNGGNANAQFWQGLWVSDNGTGIFMDGIDSNAGLIQMVETRNNTNHIHDDSGLGNTYIATLSDGTHTGGHYLKHTGPANYSTLVGTYIEGSPVTEGSISLTGYGLILGGALSVYSGLYYGRPTVSPHGYSNLGFRTMSWPGVAAGKLSVQIPGGPDSAMKIWHLDEPSNHWQLWKFISAQKQWLMSSFNGGGTYSSQHTGATHASGPAHTVVNP